MAKVETGKVIRKTVKRKSEIVLPGTTTTIYQSNRVTNGRYQGFTLIHSKLLVGLIYQLQQAIQYDMDGRNWRQLQLFEESKNNSYRIGIPLSSIGSPSRYKEIFEASLDLMKINIDIEPTEKGYKSSSTLVHTVDMPIKEGGKSVLYLHVFKDITAQLIKIDKSLNGRPEKFTKYLYEVAIGAKNKYTYKIYWLISSWKSKGGFRISYEKFREQLGIEENEYKEYADFKRRILIPVQKELEKRSDCWFNCNANGFEIRNEKKVIALNFKVIIPELEEEYNKKADYIRQLLRMHASFKDNHIKEVDPIFKADNEYQDIILRVQELIMYVKENRQTIINQQAYIIKSLLNQFCSSNK